MDKGDLAGAASDFDHSICDQAMALAPSFARQKNARQKNGEWDWSSSFFCLVSLGAQNDGRNRRSCYRVHMLHDQRSVQRLLMRGIHASSLTDFSASVQRLIRGNTIGATI